MRALLFLALFMILFLLIITVFLLFKIKKLKIELKNNKENVWHSIAMKDGLTGIYNRTAYNTHISEIVKITKLRVLGLFFLILTISKR